MSTLDDLKERGEELLHKGEEGVEHLGNEARHVKDLAEEKIHMKQHEMQEEKDRVEHE